MWRRRHKFNPVRLITFSIILLRQNLLDRRVKKKKNLKYCKTLQNKMDSKGSLQAYCLILVFVTTTDKHTQTHTRWNCYSTYCSWIQNANRICLSRRSCLHFDLCGHNQWWRVCCAGDTNTHTKWRTWVLHWIIVVTDLLISVLSANSANPTCCRVRHNTLECFYALYCFLNSSILWNEVDKRYPLHFITWLERQINWWSIGCTEKRKMNQMKSPGGRRGKKKVWKS